MKKLKAVNKYFLLIVVPILIITGYLLYTKVIKKPVAGPQYQTGTVERGTLVETVTASGSVSSANNTPVVTQVTGKIKKLYIKNGDQVKVGQILATVDLDQSSNQKYIQQLASYQNATSTLESAKISLRQMKTDALTADNAFIKGALEKGKDEDSLVYQQLRTAKRVAEEKAQNQEKVVQAAQLSVSSAALILQNYSPTIYAPISGIISGLAYQEGSVIPAQAVSSSNTVLSQNIAYITTSSLPIVSVNLTEIDIPKVEIGDKATVTFDAFPDMAFTGKVFSVNTTGSSTSGVTSYPTTIILDLENSKIYANMSANSSIIITSKDNVLFVPSSAVVTQNGSPAVRKLVNGKVQYAQVETGITSDTSTEIISGLNEGDAVITSIVTPSSGTSGGSPFGIRTGGFGGGAQFRRD